MRLSVDRARLRGYLIERVMQDAQFGSISLAPNLQHYWVLGFTELFNTTMCQ